MYGSPDSASARAKQACLALIREDLAETLAHAIANGTLAQDYLAAEDDLAARYLIHRLRLFANHAGGLALELREDAA